MRSNTTRLRLLSFHLFFIATLFFSLNAGAQCSYSGSDFQSVDSLPCIVVGQSADFYIPYRCLDTILASYTDSFGHVMRSDRSFSLQIESLSNIPCGLSMAIDASQNPIARGQTGCLHLYGTATDSVGYYLINATISFNIFNNVPGFTHQNVSAAAYLPISRLLVIRLVNPADPCTPQMEVNKIYQISHCN